MPSGRKKHDVREVRAHRTQKAKPIPTASHGDRTDKEYRQPSVDSWLGFAREKGESLSVKDEANDTGQRYLKLSNSISLRKSRVPFVSIETTGAQQLIQPSTPLTHPTPSPRLKTVKSVVSERGVCSSISAAPLQSQCFTNEQTPGSQLRHAFSQMEDAEGMPSSDVKEDEVMESDIAAQPIRESYVQPKAPFNPEATQLFFEDNLGFANPISTGLPPPQLEQPQSPTPSQASEEEIVFTGRHKLGKALQAQGSEWQDIPNSHQSAVPDTFATPSTKIIDDHIHTTRDCGREQKDKGSVRTSHRSSASPTGYQEKHQGHAARNDEVIRDYISNIEANGNDVVDLNVLRFESTLRGQQYEYEGADLLSSNMKYDDEWDSADIANFEDFSTSDEEVQDIVKVVGRRERSSGTQYLVVSVGSSINDARWLPLQSLADNAATAALLRTFDETSKRPQDGTEDEMTDGSLTDEAQTDLDVQEALDDLKDDEDVEERRKARMTDEQIARLLSKQEELGLGSKNLILFDGADGDDFYEPGLDKNNFGLLQKVEHNLRGKRRAGGATFTATKFSRLVDQGPHDRFDILDHGRASLKKRPKGKCASMAFQLSDSEMERSLEAAWEHDRSKKKVRKKAREELRAQGLLGKNKAHQPDLKAKYLNGITIDQIKSEIAQFLDSPKESLSLPPMDASARKIVHEAGHNLALKTRSMGSGNKRFPIIYKTSRTCKFDDHAFAHMGRKFVPRLGQKRKQRAQVSSARHGGGPGAVYRDGEEVGGSAPELSVENKGRAMLEKMGWSTGKALGAPNNKGISEPIAQIVRTTRAGLG